MSTDSKKQVALLALADGAVFAGYAFGAAALCPSREPQETEAHGLPGFGETVINTAMTGYPEVLTDRSYRGQLLVMTYPHIGNYGIDHRWSEARAQDGSPSAAAIGGAEGAGDAQLNGLVIRELYRPQPTDAPLALDAYLAASGVPGLCDVDTRALTLHIRGSGALLGAIVSAPDGFPRWDTVRSAEGEGSGGVQARRHQIASALRGDTDRLKADFPEYYQTLQQYLAALEQRYRYDLVATLPLLRNSADAGGGGVSAGGDANAVGHADVRRQSAPQQRAGRRVLLYDCGCKRSIIACLQDAGCAVEVIGHDQSADALLERAPDLLVLSNGPGDPAPLKRQVASVRGVVGKVPILAICMGNQLLAQALGARTHRLPFGHHGVNHPVSCSTTDRLYVTSQNHEYTVDEATLPDSVEVWFRNTNDNTVEGIIDHARHLYSVQFHPESAPGPHDTRWIFRYVIEQIGAMTKVA